MTIMFAWLLKFLLIYWVVKAFVSFFSGQSSISGKKKKGENKTPERFDSKGKKIEEADFKEL